MVKSPDAFRTISEVADWLGIQAHVLRFWESKFTQVRPIKRAGGRRYFRPQDMLLLGGIKKLLHDDGLTIKGVQKILREQGVEHVSGLSQPLDEHAETGELVPSPEKVAALKVQTEPQEPDSATLLHFPGGAEAETDLTGAPYEQTEEELAPLADSTPEEEASAPETPVSDLPEDTPSAEDATPSFFSMFDGDSGEAPAEPQIEEQAVEETAEQTAQACGEEPELSDTSPPAAMPAVVDVPVDADSQAGAGILTRLMQAKSAGLTAEPALLQELRGQIRALTGRLTQN